MYRLECWILPWWDVLKSMYEFIQVQAPSVCLKLNLGYTAILEKAKSKQSLLSRLCCVSQPWSPTSIECQRLWHIKVGLDNLGHTLLSKFDFVVQPLPHYSAFFFNDFVVQPLPQTWLMYSKFKSNVDPILMIYTWSTLHQNHLSAELVSTPKHCSKVWLPACV